jgi:broad specificity phosphatase PhoE
MPTSRPQLVVIRHGETAWTLSGQHTGRTDIPLTENGLRQADAIKSLLGEYQFVRVLTSPLQRAIQTCERAGLAGRADVTADLLEWDYGDDEGRTTAEIRAEVPGWSLWRDGVPGGETAADVGRRADRIISAVRLGDGDVAAVGHGHMLRVLAARWLGLPPSEGRLFALDPGTVGVLGWEREATVLRRWNQPAG